MNFPLDKIHHITWSWGWLLLPFFDGWIIKTKKNGFRFVRYSTFHNCRVRGK